MRSSQSILHLCGSSSILLPSYLLLSFELGGPTCGPECSDQPSSGPSAVSGWPCKVFNFQRQHWLSLCCFQLCLLGIALELMEVQSHTEGELMKTWSLQKPRKVTDFCQQQSKKKHRKRGCRVSADFYNQIKHKVESFIVLWDTEAWATNGWAVLCSQTQK